VDATTKFVDARAASKMHSVNVTTQANAECIL
jgi:hypothetical protein